MKASQFLVSTLKEAPADAEVVSHQLMIRAGMIKKLGAGIYNYMPMGLRVIRKVEAIVREEMDRAGAIELTMPVVQPAELAAVAKLPKKEVLIAMLLSAMQGPIRGVVYTLNAVLSKFVRVIAAIQDKRKGEGDMSATTTKLSQEELIKAIEGMSVLDLAELVKGLETRFGVTAAAPVAVAAAETVAAVTAVAAQVMADAASNSAQ